MQSVVEDVPGLPLRGNRLLPRIAVIADLAPILPRARADDEAWRSFCAFRAGGARRVAHGVLG